MPRQWTPEQRAQQAEKIKQWQPWANSTGARTPEGKAVASRNAYKGGTRTVLREIARFLRDQRESLEAIG